MNLLYTDVPPLHLPEGSQDITSYMNKCLDIADSCICTVGYASKQALIELDHLVRENNINSVTLVLGMYCIEGFPEGIYNTAVAIDKAWRMDGIGEIRVTNSMKYHAKAYGFYKSSQIFSASIGSHNLGSLAKDASNIRQYELSFHTESPDEILEIDTFLKTVTCSPVSMPLCEYESPLIIHQENQKLDGVEGVKKMPQESIDYYVADETPVTFDIPLKVPGMPDSPKQDYMKSNINKCYAKGRLNTRSGIISERGWWETEIIVGKKITTNPSYPERDNPFFVITDDGWKFLMHVSGDHKKNLESEGDLKILGYWLKGRLVAAEIVDPVDSPAEDLKNADESLTDKYENCKGVITYSKLLRYGRTSVTLTKTTDTLKDEAGVLRDVWVLSFLPQNVK